MNKLQLTLGGLLLPLIAYATVTEPPKGVRFEKGVYALKMSPNGKWIGSYAGDASMYNVETGENIYHDGTSLGVGKSVANNGMAAGDANDRGVLLFQGRTIFPPTLNKSWFCDINSITPDGKRIAGTCNNPVLGVSLMYVPFVADIDENGNVGEPVILPHPDEDFFRAMPQYSTINYMSDDGKTCIGQMVDWRGMFSVPIYYQEDENGVWSYTLPTKDFFNPTGIEIPDNPWLSEPELPEPEDLMDPMMREAYQNKYDEWLASGGNTPKPDYTAYMTDEQYEQYKQAVENYNEWYDSVEQKIKEYVPIYNEILKTSPSFSGNDACLSAKGDFFLTTGGVEDEEGNRLSYLYKIYTDGREMEKFTMPNRGLYPTQMLSDNTTILSKGIRAVPDSWMFHPETGEFTYINDYLRQDYPEIVDWIEENFPYGNGYILMSDDKSVITGALTPGQFLDFDEYNDYYYHTYIIGATSLGDDGIEMLVQPEDGIYRVYDLKGVKILETKDASSVNSLGKGIYVVNGKKVVIN